MALIKCEECEKEYSDKAEACPNCGCPTTYTIKNDTEEKCSVPINGDEALHKGKFPLWIKLAFVIPVIALVLFLIFLKITENPDIRTSTGAYFSIVMTFIVPYVAFYGPLVYFIGNFTPTNKNRLKDNQKINQWFQKRFPILNFLKPQYKVLGVSNYTDVNFETAMFLVYMDAYKKNADAIVLNDSTSKTYTTTNVDVSRRNVSVNAQSINRTSVSATLIKY
jgi:hypothetical protein